jgi:hypothetical protein
MASPRIRYTIRSIKGSDLSMLKEITNSAANFKQCPSTDKDRSTDSNNTVTNSMGFHHPMSFVENRFYDIPNSMGQAVCILSLKTDSMISRTQWDKQVVYQSERL